MHFDLKQAIKLQFPFITETRVVSNIYPTVIAVMSAVLEVHDAVPGWTVHSNVTVVAAMEGEWQTADSWETEIN